MALGLVSNHYIHIIIASVITTNKSNDGGLAGIIIKTWYGCRRYIDKAIKAQSLIDSINQSTIIISS